MRVELMLGLYSSLMMYVQVHQLSLLPHSLIFLAMPFSHLSIGLVAVKSWELDDKFEVWERCIIAAVITFSIVFGRVICLTVSIQHKVALFSENAGIILALLFGPF